MAALLTLCIVTIPGCNILGPAMVLAHGPAKTPARHILEKDRPTVVFVDDRSNVLPRRAIRQQIAEAAQDALLKKGALTNVIHASAAMAAATREPSGRPMDIVSLGKAASADVVIYVTVDSYSLTPDGQTYLPEARFHVKVLDITRQTPRVWPPEQAGCPVAASLNTRSAVPPRGVAEQTTALNQLAARSGLIIAQLFYEHETNEHIRDNQ
jgi:hypothetical protein